MSDKTYVGKGWTSKYGVQISIKKEEIDKLPVNKYGDILLEVLPRREKDAKSKATHYVIVNDYAYQKLSGQEEEADGMPF